MSVNKCILVGNVGKDPEVRNLQGGAKVATITLATTEKFKDREETEWHTVVIWNNLADVVEKYVKKGSQLYIEGRIKTEKYTKDGQDRFIVKIVASSLQLLGKKESSSPAEPTQQRVPLYQQATQMPAAPEPTDDLPFD
jgi:single-strand DNA-binding protein